MNSAAASAAVYSLFAILLMAVVIALLPEVFRSWARLRAVEAATFDPDSRDTLSAAAVCLLLESPERWIGWALRGFPPPADLLHEAEVRSALSRL